MTENYFTLWDEKMNTIDVLSGHDLVLDADRRFTIAVDSDPKGDRPNHIRSAPEALEFYIRDVMLDWSKDEPNELSIERLGRRRRATPPRTRDEQAELTARYMLRFADFTQKIAPRHDEQPPEQVRARLLGRQGRRAAQAGLHRRELQARRRRGVGDRRERRRRRATSSSRSGTSGARRSTSSTARAASTRRSRCRNADGTYTFVLSRSDPGVHNWIDPCDLGEGILTLRMAEFPGGRPSDDLSARSRVVPLARLRDELPAETKWVTPAERAAQRAERAAAYAAASARALSGRTSRRMPESSQRRRRLADHRLLDRHRPPDRAGRAREGPPRRRHRAQAAKRSRTSSPRIRSGRSRSRSTSRSAIRSTRAVRETERAFGGIDVLVNNAGYGYMAAVEEGEDDEIRALFDTNYFGAVDDDPGRAARHARARRAATSSTSPR